MERYVAIDNVCAWPNLTRMPDGRIVATIFNQPCHGSWAGDVECWESADEGRFWKLCGVPAPHEPGTNRMNVAAGLARNGDLVVIASGWSNKAEKGCAPAAQPSPKPQVIPAWVCRSTDGGRTWRHAEGGFPPPPGQTLIIPFGKIIFLPDGSLGVSGYSENREGVSRVNESWFFRSRDDGRTWGEHVMIAPDYHNETDLLWVEGQRLIAAARGGSDARLDQYVSEDGGATWSIREPLAGPMQHPAHLLKLGDGSLIVTYGIRHRGCYGVGARFSEDGGRVWYGPMVLVQFGSAWDGGYPASVQLKDGGILTAYYAAGADAHVRYHMGVVHWTVREMMALNRNPNA